jgi:hypothetical protein
MQFSVYWRTLSTVTLREWVRVIVLTAAIFGVVGTITALWPNPIFVRMTPSAGYEIGLLGIEALLMGFYFGLDAPACRVGLAGGGGVLGFLGVACPVCNKVLVLIFGSSVLLTYFEPIRPLVGAVGIALMMVALLFRLRLRGADRGLIDLA